MGYEEIALEIMSTLSRTVEKRSYKVNREVSNFDPVCRNLEWSRCDMNWFDALFRELV